MIKALKRKFFMATLQTNRCTICLVSFPEDIKAFSDFDKSPSFGCNCKVYFHEECWTQFLKDGNKCPFCRKKIQNIQVIIQDVPPIIELPLRNVITQQRGSFGCKNHIIPVFFCQYFLVEGLLYVSGVAKMFIEHGWKDDYHTLFFGFFGSVVFLMTYFIFLWMFCTEKKLGRISYTIYRLTIFLFFIDSNIAAFCNSLNEYLFMATLLWLMISYFCIIFRSCIFLCDCCYYKVI
jgi:hypothetical protein